MAIDSFEQARKNNHDLMFKSQSLQLLERIAVALERLADRHSPETPDPDRYISLP
jgi:hypothetical protein